jgi:hypothetical protein
MSKKTPSPPPAPDPIATSAAQTQGNKDTALYNSALNRPDEYTPYGSRTYTTTYDTPQYDETGYQNALAAWTAAGAQSPGIVPSGGNPYSRGTQEYTDWGEGRTTQAANNRGAMPDREKFRNADALPHVTSRINFTPEGQKLFDAEQAQNAQINEIAGGYMDKIRGSMGAPNLEADDAARQRIEAALMERMNPYLEQDRNAMESKLANQGITHGSEAYGRSQADFGKNVNDARLAAIAQAGNEQSRLFQLGVASRELPLNEFNALRSASQVTPPQFQGMQPVATQPTDIAGNVYKSYSGQQDAYNAKVGAQNATTSGLFGLGGSIGAAAIMASDINLKTAIKPIRKENGFNIYEFKYLGHETVYSGVMAQEIEKIMPDAVVMMPNGFLAVDYGMLGITMKKVH